MDYYVLLSIFIAFKEVRESITVFKYYNHTKQIITRQTVTG